MIDGMRNGMPQQDHASRRTGTNMLKQQSNESESSGRESLGRRRRRDIECLVWHADWDTRGMHVHKRANIVTPLVAELGICESSPDCPSGNSSCCFYSHVNACELRRSMLLTRGQLAALPRATLPARRINIALAC